jgi:SRSO17 transposase
VELRLPEKGRKTILRVFPTVMEDHSRRIVRMTLKQIAGLGRELAAFLGLFADCFGRREGRQLLRVYIQGQLSDLHRKTAEAMALRFGKAPRTLQRFLEWIKWDEEGCHDRCQQMVAREHAHPEAIGVVDESGVAKSGDDTVGVSRQWNGNRGKVDNCVVGVHLSYAAPGFQCLLGSRLYLPEGWANDPVRRKKTTFPRRWSSRRSRGSPWG